MRRLSAISLAMLLCFAVTACGGDDKEDTSAKGSTTTTADSGKSDDSKGDDSKGDDSSDDASSADDQALEAKLLTVQDVGSQWKVEYSSADDSSDDDDSADDADDDDSDDPECLKQLDDIESADSAAEADITFSSGDDDEDELSQEIDAYEGKLDGAHDEFDQAAKLLDGCGEFSMDFDGTEGHGSVKRIDDVHYGDQSGLWEISIEAAGFQYTEAIAIVFVDDLTVNFSLGQAGASAAEDLKPYIEKGLAKL